MDVAKRNGLLEVTIVCGNRPGLLVDIMEAIECSGLTILHTRIACHNEILVEHFSLEVNESSVNLAQWNGCNFEAGISDARWLKWADE